MKLIMAQNILDDVTIWNFDLYCFADASISSWKHIERMCGFENKGDLQFLNYPFFNYHKNSHFNSPLPESLEYLVYFVYAS